MRLLSLPPHFSAWHFPLGTFDNFQPSTFNPALYEHGMSLSLHFQLNYKDHLGNNRLSYTLDPQTNQIKILEENHYYPFGLKHGAYNQTRKDIKYKEQAASKKEVKQVVPDQVKFKYLYNNKELQDELGLNVYDYGAESMTRRCRGFGRWIRWRKSMVFSLFMFMRMIIRCFLRMFLEWGWKRIILT